MRWIVTAGIVAMLVCVGCSKEPTKVGADAKQSQAQSEDPAVAKAMAELSAEDRTVAEAQRFCAVANDSKLGGMGKPYKLMIEGQPVFLCCEGCKEEALKDPKATLAKVEKLKQATTGGAK